MKAILWWWCSLSPMSFSLSFPFDKLKFVGQITAKLHQYPILLLACMLLALPVTAFAQAPTTASKPAIKLKVTGHYAARSKSAPNSMEVQELPGGKIKFHILALWVSYYNRDNVHNGETQGTIDLVGDTATYQEERCRITIRFTKTAAIVKQSDDLGDCDYGANVTATGTYRKLNSRKPKFDY